MYAATGGPNVKWGGTVFKWGGRAPLPPRWRRPWCFHIKSNNCALDFVVLGPCANNARIFVRNYALVGVTINFDLRDCDVRQKPVRSVCITSVLQMVARGWLSHIKPGLVCFLVPSITFDSCLEVVLLFIDSRCRQYFYYTSNFVPDL